MSLVKSSLIVMAIAFGLDLVASQRASSPPDHSALLVDIAAVRAPASAERSPAPEEPAAPALHASARPTPRFARWPM